MWIFSISTGVWDARFGSVRNCWTPQSLRQSMKKFNLRMAAKDPGDFMKFGYVLYMYIYIYNMYRDLYKFSGIGSEYALFGWIYLHLFTIGWLVLGCKLIQAHPVLSGLFPIYNCPKGKGEEGSSTSGYVKCAKHRHPEHTNITNFISPLITSVFFL